jgi:nicotinamidase-related amidase
MNYLIVVDMQNDFIDGALGTKEAEAIVATAADYVRNFSGTVIFTRDTHTADYAKTQEGRKLPVPHCIKGEKGWQLCPEMQKLCEGRMIFDKPTFGSVELAKYIAEQGDAEVITLIGLCTDICVISNAMLLKAFMPEVTIRVREDCCAGVTPESHRRALCSMSSCQIDICRN